MKVTVDLRAPADVAADLLAVPIGTARRGAPRLSPRVAALDRANRGLISSALSAGDFTGRANQTLLLYPSGGRARARRLLLVGLGDEQKLEGETLRRVAGSAVAAGSQRRAGRVALVVPSAPEDSADDFVQALAEGGVLASYRFDGYREKREGDPGAVASLGLLMERGSNLRAARAAAKRGEVLADCQNVARRLSDMPPNDLPPEALAKEARRIGREVGLRVRVLEVPALEREKAGGILAVGGGSVNPPRLIALEYGLRPGGEKSSKKKGKKAAKSSRSPAPFCLVGKGITFDSGGISIKPAPAMDEMKHDMSGAAAVIGALRACALLELPFPVVGVIGAAENLPSGSAYRPGDVVRTMSGKTIEVLNTDAEGRVVLADALHYARTRYEPCAIVDLATLTGACMIALGRWATGLFTNNEKLAEQLRAAGDRTGELAWPMPLLDGHKEDIRSQIADIKNTGGRTAGASTAAAFLSHFVGDTAWAHLDIAGTGWTSNPSPYQPKGATGVGVRMLLELLAGWDPESLAD